MQNIAEWCVGKILSLCIEIIPKTPLFFTTWKICVLEKGFLLHEKQRVITSEYTGKIFLYFLAEIFRTMHEVFTKIFVVLCWIYFTNRL